MIRSFIARAQKASNHSTRGETMNNILLLVVDSLRADHISCYGYHKETKNIDRLANKGSIYTKAWSEGSYTASSIPHILSEYLLYQLGKTGYALPAVVHSNPKITRYLETYKLGYINIDLHPKEAFSRLRNMLRIVLNGVYRGEARAETINSKAIKIIKELKAPFFLCLWYMDVHAPFFPPHRTGISDILLNHRYLKAIHEDNPKIDKESLQKIIENYDNEISYFDSTLGKLLKEIPEDTHIILTADHGEEFLEDGNLGHHDKEIPELRHVPLIIKSPHNSPAVIEEPFKFKEFDQLILTLSSIPSTTKEGS